jgi:hypothetical protein
VRNQKKEKVRKKGERGDGKEGKKDGRTTNRKNEGYKICH